MTAEQRILSEASSLFLQFGVRNVTMDEVAQKLGISKKTIYQHFRNKADMIFQVANAYFAEEEAVSNRISQDAPNAVAELIGILNWTQQTLRTISPTLLIEVQKYYPKTWQLFDAFRSGFLFQKVHENLTRGIQEGLFRQNLNLEIVSRFRTAQIESSIDNKLFPTDRFDMLTVQHQMMDLYVHSIATPAGLKEYQQLLEK